VFEDYRMDKERKWKGEEEEEEEEEEECGFGNY